jgi:arylsulfatase A-like enzyme
MRIVLVTLVMVMALVPPPAARSAAPPAQPRPNIIFLLADDQRYDTLGVTGHPFIQTPHLDKLAAAGACFDRAYVTTAICSINRATIFTGQYASRHGIIDFATPISAEQFPQTYPGRLRAAGYHTGFIGKWGVGKPRTEDFDVQRGFPGQGNYWNTVDGVKAHLNTTMAQSAAEFIASAPKDKPFCLSVSFKTPHAQEPESPDRTSFPPDTPELSLYDDVVVPPYPLSDPAFFESLPEFLRTSENRRRWTIRFDTPAKYQKSVKDYLRLITGMDRAVGVIVEKLREEGLDGNTVIVFTSDHGFYLGERGFAGKWYPHEVSMRVPLIVYDPRMGDGQRGLRPQKLALSIDIAPTLLDLAGLPPSPGMQGRSLLPLVAGQNPRDWPDTFFYEHPFKANRGIPRTVAIRTPDWKYIRYLDGQPGYEEFYHLRTDPDEAVNLAGDPSHADTLAKLRARCDAEAERVK